MAKYNITYSCGHEGTVELVGPGKERERRIWYYKNHCVCSECEQKAKDEANAKAAETAKALGLSELIGSEKQVAWANTLRENVRKEWTEFLRKMDAELATLEGNESKRDAFQKAKESRDLAVKTMDYIFGTKTSAGYWIEAREYGIQSFVRRAYKAHQDQIDSFDPEREKMEETDVQAIEAKAEATIKPEGEVRGIAQVKVEDDKVVAIYPKDDKFRSIVKDKKYRWDADNTVWYRRIGVTTGSASDRAAEIINALLRAGFAVTCFDEAARAKAVDASFEPECERWILRNSDTTLKAVFPKDYNVREHIVRCGGKWSESSYGYVLDPARFTDIEELARVDGFRFSDKAQAMLDAVKAAVSAAQAVTAAKPTKKTEDGLKKILDSSREVLSDLKDE